MDSESLNTVPHVLYVQYSPFYNSETDCTCHRHYPQLSKHRIRAQVSNQCSHTVWKLHNSGGILHTNLENT